MKNLRQGYWNFDIASGRKFPALAGTHEADALLIGGGLSGMWTAYEIKKQDPSKEVVLLERDFLGFGPSGRSGGIVYDLWLALPRLSRLLDPVAARKLARLSEECIEDIKQLPDTDWQQSGVLHISTNPFHDERSAATRDALAAAGRDDLFQELSPEETAKYISSPRWRKSTFYPHVGVVHPAKMVRALRDRLEKMEVRIFESSEVLSVDRVRGGWRARTAGGSVVSPRVLRATGCALPGTIISSSHMVVSEPLPDINKYWPSQVAATDERSTVRYMRKTGDRVAFGWGFGKADWNQDLRSGDPVQAEAVARVFYEFFPFWADRKLEFSWGGPIDISPTHLPLIRENAPGLWSVTGYTGNGMGPSRTLGHIAALSMLGHKHEFQLPKPLFPLPHPRILRPLGAMTRSVMLRREAQEEQGKEPTWASRFLSELPGRLGVELGR